MRQARRRLYLHIGRARHRAENLRYLLGLAVENIEIVAENVDDHGRRIPGYGLFHSLGEKRFHRKIHARKTNKDVPNIGGDKLRFIAPKRLQIDLEFAVMRAPGILGCFRPADALRDQPNGRQLGQRLRYQSADAQRFVDRSAGHRRHMDDEMSLLQFGHKGAAKERKRGASRQRQYDSRCDKRTRPSGNSMKEVGVTGL